MSYLEHVKPRIEKWKEEAEPWHKYMSVNNSSWHMSVFPRFHTTLSEIKAQIEKERADSMCYSTTSVVWDLENDCEVYVWHSDPFPLPSQEDAEQYFREEADRKKEGERKAEEQRKILEKNTLAEEMQSVREEKYRLHVEKCINSQVIPLPFYKFQVEEDARNS
jgi:hypothetical protein